MVDPCMYEDARGKRCDHHARKGSLFCERHDPGSGSGAWRQVAFGLTKAALVAGALLEYKEQIERLIKILTGMHDKDLPAMEALEDLQRQAAAALLFVQTLPPDDVDSPELAQGIQQFDALKTEFAAWDRKKSAAFIDRDLATAEND